MREIMIYFESKFMLDFFMCKIILGQRHPEEWWPWCPDNNDSIRRLDKTRVEEDMEQRSYA